MVALVACSESDRLVDRTGDDPSKLASATAQRQQASDPHRAAGVGPCAMAGDLIADEQALRDPSSSEEMC